MSVGPAYEVKEEVRRAIDIVELVGSYLPLRRQGSRFVGLCPWHDDTRPSLQVNPERQSWKCWVCNIGGDIFSFVMQREGIGFREALALLADRAGVELAPPGAPSAPPGGPGDKRTLYQAAAWAEQQFHQYLLRSPEAEPARRYIEERGITPASVERFHLGYSPDRWQWLVDRAQTAPFSTQVLEAIGLVGRSPTSGQLYDRFKGRVIFPIRDTQSRPIAFGGRILPQWAEREEAAQRRPPAKYINSPETPLFSKSDQLYGLDIVRTAVARSRQIVVVEGYTDVVMARQCGLDNVVAVLGTALGERHIRLLRRFADVVTLVLDGDEAGKRRTNEILELFVAADLELRILTLPAGVDPCDFLLEHGAEPFRQLLAGAVDALEHKVRIETRGIDIAHDTHRANRALEAILHTLAKAPRLQGSTSTAKRLREQHLLAGLAHRFHVDESVLRARLNELRRTTKPLRATGSSAGGGAAAAAPPLDPKDAELLEILILHPELAATAVEQIPVHRLLPGPGREIFATICKLQAAGPPPQFARVMTHLDDAKLKGLLVQLDERAREKAGQAREDAPARLRGLIEAFAQRESENECRKKMAALQKQQLNGKEELDLLEQLIQHQRSRQGISGPTDG